MGGSPPTESGRVRFDRMPRSRALSRSTAASAGNSSREPRTQPCGRAHLLHEPGVLLLAQRRDRRHTFQAQVDVRGRKDIRGRIRPLPQHREIDAEKLADSAQRVFDLAIHLAGGRLMNREERSEISVSNSRRLPKFSAACRS